MPDDFVIARNTEPGSTLPGSHAGRGVTRAGSDDLLEATLRPALQAPFSSIREPTDPVADPDGPWPEPDAAYQLCWRAGAAEVATALPGLWALPQVASGHGWTCVEQGDRVDLVVDVDVLGRLVAVDVGTMPLSQVLAALGDPDGAAAAAQAVGQPAEVAGPALADLLERLWLLGAG